MKVERLVAMTMLLLEHRKISAKALAKQFEVSLRTIYRDIETINLAGIPIASAPGVGGGFYIMDQYKVDRRVFTASELATLLTGIGSVAPMLDREEFIHTLAKVKSLIPKEKAHDIELKSTQILIDLTPWMGNQNLHSFLELIKTALQKQVVISFAYSDRKGRMSQRQVEPYRLALKDNHWYLQGFCLDKREFRLFKLSRMSRLKVLDETFARRELPAPFSDFTDRMTQKQCVVKLRIHESLCDRLLDYCGSEHFKACGENQYIVEFPFIADEFGYNLLLGFGARCECLEPPEVRAEISRRVGELAKLYKGAGSWSPNILGHDR